METSDENVVRNLIVIDLSGSTKFVTNYNILVESILKPLMEIEPEKNQLIIFGQQAKEVHLDEYCSPVLRKQFFVDFRETHGGDTKFSSTANFIDRKFENLIIITDGAITDNYNSALFEKLKNFNIRNNCVMLHIITENSDYRTTLLNYFQNVDIDFEYNMYTRGKLTKSATIKSLLNVIEEMGFKKYLETTQNFEADKIVLRQAYKDKNSKIIELVNSLKEKKIIKRILKEDDLVAIFYKLNPDYASSRVDSLLDFIFNNRKIDSIKINKDGILVCPEISDTENKEVEDEEYYGFNDDEIKIIKNEFNSIQPFGDKSTKPKVDLPENLKKCPKGNLIFIISLEELNSFKLLLPSDKCWSSGSLNSNIRVLMFLEMIKKQNNMTDKFEPGKHLAFSDSDFENNKLLGELLFGSDACRDIFIQFLLKVPLTVSDYQKRDWNFMLNKSNFDLNQITLNEIAIISLKVSKFIAEKRSFEELSEKLENKKDAKKFIDFWNSFISSTISKIGSSVMYEFFCYVLSDEIDKTALREIEIYDIVARCKFLNFMKGADKLGLLCSFAFPKHALHISGRYCKFGFHYDCNTIISRCPVKITFGTNDLEERCFDKEIKSKIETVFGTRFLDKLRFLEKSKFFVENCEFKVSDNICEKILNPIFDPSTMKPIFCKICDHNENDNCRCSCYRNHVAKKLVINCCLESTPESNSINDQKNVRDLLKKFSKQLIRQFQFDDKDFIKTAFIGNFIFDWYKKNRASFLKELFIFKTKKVLDLYLETKKLDFCLEALHRNVDVIFQAVEENNVNFMWLPSLLAMSKPEDLTDVKVCPICLDNFTGRQDLLLEICENNHSMCKNCSKVYRLSFNFCPYCRSPSVW